jgi:hypothetical protein
MWRKQRHDSAPAPANGAPNTTCAPRSFPPKIAQIKYAQNTHRKYFKFAKRCFGLVFWCALSYQSLLIWLSFTTVRGRDNIQCLWREGFGPWFLVLMARYSYLAPCWRLRRLLLKSSSCSSDDCLSGPFYFHFNLLSWLPLRNWRLRCGNMEGREEMWNRGR